MLPSVHCSFAMTLMCCMVLTTIQNLVPSVFCLYKTPKRTNKHTMQRPETVYGKDPDCVGEAPAGDVLRESGLHFYCNILIGL